MNGKRIVILAGPNGAGKTTFAREFLPNEAHCPIFINADLIAAGLAPFQPEQAAFQAGRLMLELIHERVERGDSFAFETTLAGKAYAREITKWRDRDYRVTIHFLSLSSAEIAIARVAHRVRQGGHDIPEGVIRRRFRAGKFNFEAVYKPLVDDWFLYDSGGRTPVLLAQGANP